MKNYSQKGHSMGQSKVSPDRSTVKKFSFLLIGLSPDQKSLYREALLCKAQQRTRINVRVKLN